MRIRAWLSVIGLFGCAHAKAPHIPAQNAPAVAKVAVATQPIVEVAALGLQVRLPGPAELFDSDSRAADGPMRTQGAGCTLGKQSYYVARTFRAGRDRIKDEALLKNAKNTLKTVSREAPVVQGEWSGVELEGTDNAGHGAWLRMYAVGDGFWIAQVQGPDSAFDRAAGRTFFDSIVFSQPWSVHAFPEGHFSALLPDGGVRLDKKTLHAEHYTVAEMDWLGGTQARAFGVWAIPLEGNAPADERMDRASESLTQDGHRVVWQAPIIVDAARGRDFLSQKDDAWTRIRVIVTATDLYMLQAVAHTKEALLDESVPRFLASLRWY